ncbi:DUF2332 domain-containing protein [Dactylosporangium sp. CS-047395]|uniref:DUF2332 domain-containing protein n=1 Tax=Dactylosporangium sp. CS-047395 TaxID=3239936 RepID=UPI003D92878E
MRETGTAEQYRFFATVMARGSSPLYEELALGVAADPEMLALLDGLPPAKRQPNLLLAAARLVGGVPSSYGQLRETVFGRRDEVVAAMLARRTQTNEPGRCAGLYPALASLPQPLALLEVGASAGLLLLVERYGYEYTGTDRVTHGGAGDGAPLLRSRVDGPAPDVTHGGAGDGAPLLRCRVDGPAPDVTPGAVQVAWRAGIDLNPLDVTDDEDAEWLRTLVWPEQQERRARLDAAIELARRDPPRVVAGDLNDRLDALAAEAPADATLVVLHTAVLDYVPEPGRGAFVEKVRGLRGHWLSQEGADVFPHIAARLREPAPKDEAAYLVSLDERPLAFTALHGSWLRPIAETALPDPAEAAAPGRPMAR